MTAPIASRASQGGGARPSTTAANAVLTISLIGALLFGPARLVPFGDLTRPVSRAQLVCLTRLARAARLTRLVRLGPGWAGSAGSRPRLRPSLRWRMTRRPRRAGLHRPLRQGAGS